MLGSGPAIGEAVVERADYVCYTGSTATGRQVAQVAARRLVGISLELGGKNTMYVAADADLERAAEGAVRACFNGAGQLCVAMERLVVHEQVADRFLALFLQPGPRHAARRRAGLERRHGLAAVDRPSWTP